MHALEFLLNGERICVAAAGEDDLVVSNLAMTGVLEGVREPCVRLRVGGVRRKKHVEWFSRPLKMGDKVEIRLVDALKSDAPEWIDLI